MTAVSAVVASLGMTGVVLLATAPMTVPRANAAQVLADPTQIEPTDPTVTDDPGAEPEGPAPTVTVTITEDPEPTVTKTKTVNPKPTKKPTPTRSANPSATKTAPVVPPVDTPPASMPPLPSTPPVTPTVQPSTESMDPEPQVRLAEATPTPTLPESAQASPSFEEPTPDSVPIEIRNASPEYNQLELSRKLAIPGVLLAILVMVGVFIFEGRIRRLAHAAAVRKAGPRPPGRHRGDEISGGYPMPGYPIYQGGMAYAPIISFVPVQQHPGALGRGVPYDQHGYGGPYDQGQGLGGAIPLAPGPSDPWPRQTVPEHLAHGPGTPMVLPSGGGTIPGEPPAGVAPGTTLQGPLPGAPRRRLLGRFRRGSS